MTMKKWNKIVIAGGTGFLGQVLVNQFKNQVKHIYILTRNHKENEGNVHYVKWDGRTLGAWSQCLEGADVVINLNGKSVDCRYNNRNKKLIYDTRLDATFIIGEAIKHIKNPPKIWINAASATIYRHSIDMPMDEITGKFGTGFSVDVCQKWEECFNAIELPETRKVIIRTGIVLGKKTGAFFASQKACIIWAGRENGFWHTIHQLVA